MNKIIIRGLEITACHGVLDFEKVNAQRFIFDVDISTDFYSAAQDDNLNCTISYADVCSLIEDITKNNVFNLVEKLAYECAYSILQKFQSAEGVTLTVFKPDAPVQQKIGTVGVTVEIAREKVYLSIGSSMGDKKAMLDTAIKQLNSNRAIKVERVSDYITTKPYGGVAQNEFLNCAVSISTWLTPQELLDVIHRIEKNCGRVRDKHWGDRTLDIDIIFYGNRQIRSESLIIPHPDYKNRDFVLIPLKQIAPFLFK